MDQNKKHPKPLPGQDLGAPNEWNYIPTPDNCVVQSYLPHLKLIYHTQTDDLADITNLIEATRLYKRWLENKLKYHAGIMGVEIINYKE